MSRLNVETGAHNDMNARFAGYSGQGIRVAADARGGRVHNRAAAYFTVFPDFADGCIQIHQLKIGAVAVVVTPYPSEVLEGYGRRRQLRGWRVLGRAVHEGEVYVEVLVGGGEAQLRRMYRTEHGLDQTPIPA